MSCCSTNARRYASCGPVARHVKHEATREIGLGRRLATTDDPIGLSAPATAGCRTVRGRGA